MNFRKYKNEPKCYSVPFFVFKIFATNELYCPWSYFLLIYALKGSITLHKIFTFYNSSDFWHHSQFCIFFRQKIILFLALAFGPIHNMTTKKLVLVSPDEEEKSLLAKILAAILALVPFRKKKDAVVDEKVHKFLYSEASL